MGTIVYDNSSELIEWAVARMGFDYRSDAKAIGYQSEGTIKAVTVWDGFSQCDCNIHIVSDGTGQWLSRSFLTASFMHPFVQWGLRRVTGLVPAKNSAALRFDLHLGFKREGFIRHALPDDDIIILGMLRENCRWIPTNHRS